MKGEEMPECPKCGRWLYVLTPILLSHEMREYKGERYYYCMICDVKVPRER